MQIRTTECGTQTELQAVHIPDRVPLEIWEHPRVLERLCHCVLEWFLELQAGKPQTPSLSLHSFERRQSLKRRAVRRKLRTFDNGAGIVGFGCQLLAGEGALLSAFLDSAFAILLQEPEPEASSSSSESGECHREPPIPAFRQNLKRSASCIDLD